MSWPSRSKAVLKLTAKADFNNSNSRKHHLHLKELNEEMLLFKIRVAKQKLNNLARFNQVVPKKKSSSIT